MWPSPVKSPYRNVGRNRCLRAQRIESKILARNLFLLARALLAKASASSCVRTVSKPYLFWWLGLAFERKADAPSYCKQTQMKGSFGRFGVLCRVCKAGAHPVELHVHSRNCRVVKPLPSFVRTVLKPPSPEPYYVKFLDGEHLQRLLKLLIHSASATNRLISRRSQSKVRRTEG